MSMQQEQSPTPRLPVDEDEANVHASFPAIPTAEDAQPTCLQSLAVLSANFAWVAPLLESALTWPADARNPVQVITRWGGYDKPDEPDEEKHAAYAEHMLLTIDAVFPWLPGLLNASRIGLWIEPGVCCFVAPATGSAAIPIPQLVALSWLTPFGAAADDVFH